MDGFEGALAEGLTQRSIPISRPDITESEIAAVTACVRSGWISQGNIVADVEQMLCEITGRKHAVCVSSGTAALHLALMALRLDPDAVVGVPTFTFAAVHNAVVHARARLFMLGVDPFTWQVPRSELVQNHEQFNAVIAAPCYGKVRAAAECHDFSRSYGIPMIEDAAESFGGSYNHVPAGSFGDISTISFYANKICTAGEGGACLTDNAEFARRIRTLANHGIDNREYKPTMIGLNYRMTDLQAAILRSQLRRLPELVEKRQRVAALYSDAIAKGRAAALKPETVESMAPWMVACATNGDLQSVLQDFASAGIQVRRLFHPAHSNSLYDHFKRAFSIPSSSLWMAQRLYENGFCVPTSSALTEDEVAEVCRVLERI